MKFNASEALRRLKDRTKLIRKRPLHRLKLFLNYQVNKRNQKEPVFVIATRRSGSNLLLGYLNSIPDAAFLPEILSEKMLYGLRGRFISKKAVLKHILYSLHTCRPVVCGAKILGIHMKKHGLSPEDLKQFFPRARFIILYRESLLEQFVSLKIAERTNQWQWSQKFKLPASIFVDQGELRNYAAETKLFYQNLIKPDWVQQDSVLVSYESLATGAQNVFEEKIFPFLNLEAVSVFSPTRKQNVKKLSEIIENFREIEPLLNEPFLWHRYEASKPVLVGEAQLMMQIRA